MDVIDATEDGGNDGEGPKVEWHQEMFTDADAVQQLHPKIRRLIKAEMKSHSDMTKAKSGPVSILFVVCFIFFSSSTYFTSSGTRSRFQSVARVETILLGWCCSGVRSKF